MVRRKAAIERVRPLRTLGEVFRDEDLFSLLTSAFDIKNLRGSVG